MGITTHQDCEDKLQDHDLMSWLVTLRDVLLVLIFIVTVDL